MTELEALALKKIWDECELSEREEPVLLSSCIRQDTGNPKVKYPNFCLLKGSLFQYKINYPESEFGGYKCGICGEYHIGKKTKI